MGAHIAEKEMEEFLKLPDWKKMQLKKIATKYNNYPVMTKEQESLRIVKIFQITCHFGNMPLDTIENNPFLSVEGMWPKAYELFLTPRLLDEFDINFIINISYCLFCSFWKGYRKEFLKLSSIKNIKVLPISGHCLLAVAKYGMNRQSMVSPHSKCPAWAPTKFFSQLIIQHILTHLNKTSYTSIEFLKDKKLISFWEYFFTGPIK
jgi:hypothetical protein